MMKKIPMLLALSLTLAPLTGAHAYGDSWFDVGRNIGNAIGNSLSRGTDDKSFYCDDTYDFSKIKYLVVHAQIPENGSYVSDPFIDRKYPNMFKEAFAGKVKVKTLKEAIESYQKYWYALHPEYTPQEHVQEMMRRIAEDNGVMVNVVIAAYAQGARNTGNCWLTFTVQPYGEDAVMAYSDMRLNANRSSKEGMIGRITDSFVEKFMEARENSAKKNGASAEGR